MQGRFRAEQPHEESDMPALIRRYDNRNQPIVTQNAGTRSLTYFNQPDGSSKCFMTQDGDTFLLDRGYHPTVTSPGHEEYSFTILVGKSQRGLVQNFKEDYHYLMAGIPGIQDMVDEFK